MKGPAVAIACLLLAAAAPVAAHDGPAAELAVLDAEIKARPGDPAAWLARAALSRRLGRVDRALADLEEVARLDPERRELFLERGLARAAGGQAGPAEADLDRYLAGGPPSAVALSARAALRLAAGRLAEARADYDEAIRLRPDPELVLARGRLDERRGRLDEAAAGYEEGLRVLGGAVVVRMALVRVERRRGRFDRAVALIDEALAAAPNKADLLLARAEVHADARHADAARRDRLEALSEADRALARRPTDLARLSRGRALLALGRASEAVRELEHVVASSPKLAGAAALLDEARLAARKGKP